MSSRRIAQDKLRMNKCTEKASTHMYRSAFASRFVKFTLFNRVLLFSQALLITNNIFLIPLIFQFLAR